MIKSRLTNVMRALNDEDEYINKTMKGLKKGEFQNVLIIKLVFIE